MLFLCRAREHRRYLLDYSREHLHTAETLQRRLNYSYMHDYFLHDTDGNMTGEGDHDVDLTLPGLAVVVQQMVFGNQGRDSGTGVAYSRDPNSGAKELFG